jgi:hypothetical protein
MRRIGRSLLLAQGLYYTATGLWPLVSIRTFQLVTGPKVDTWLVKMVGALAAVIGGTLLLAVRKGRVPPEVRLLAAGSAVGFAAVDAVYALKGRISKVYLGDAPIQLAFAAAAAARGARGAGQPPEENGEFDLAPRRLA